MEARFDNVDYDYEKQFRYVASIIKKKTNLQISDIRLIINFFVFFIRRTLIDNNSFYISSFGKFYTRKFLHLGTKVFFKPFWKLRQEINQAEKLTLNKSHTHKDTQRMLTIMASGLSIKIEDLSFVFRLYLYALTKFITEKHIFCVNDLGFFELQDRKLDFKRIGNRPINIKCMKRIAFYPKKRFRQELNRMYDHIFISHTRLEYMLIHLHINKTIEKKKYKVRERKVYN